MSTHSKDPMFNTHRALGLCFLTVLVLLAIPSSQAQAKKSGHKYIGVHPISFNADDGYCVIEFPHVHKSAPPAKHKALYRDHRGQSHFIADPTPYGYEGDKHSYYGHHPVAVDVILGDAIEYESGQHLEFCYLDGAHYHGFEPQPGLTFEVKGGVSWYVGALPTAYVQGKTKYRRGNRVYTTINVARPTVDIAARPVGYVGPILDVHVHGSQHRARSHRDAHVDVDVLVSAPAIEIGFALPGLRIENHDHGHHHKHKKHKHKKHKHKKHKRRKHWSRH